MSWRSKNDSRAGELTFCRRRLPGGPCSTVLSSGRPTVMPDGLDLAWTSYRPVAVSSDVKGKGRRGETGERLRRPCLFIRVVGRATVSDASQQGPSAAGEGCSQRRGPASRVDRGKSRSSSEERLSYRRRGVSRFSRARRRARPDGDSSCQPTPAASTRPASNTQADRSRRQALQRPREADADG